MWPDTRFLDLVGVELPVIQAPMAGASGVEMAVAVSRAGGLGSLAAATLPAEELRSKLTAMREASARPFNVNFFAHTPPRIERETHRSWSRSLSHYFKELGATPAVDLVSGAVQPFGRKQCSVLEDLKPAVVSFHFGLPSPDLISRIRAAGISILSSATSVEEARWLVERGCDGIIAQGFEAGGHRASFLDSEPQSPLGLFSLVPQIADEVKVPVIAAGGVADGRGLSAAFALGAAGVQVGTAFLFTDEATLNPLAARTLRSEAARSTEITNIFSGRPARCIVNRAVEELGPLADDAPDFPLGFAAMAPLRKAAEEKGRRDFSAHYCGQSAGLCRSMSAGRLTQQLATEATQRLRWLCRQD